MKLFGTVLLLAANAAQAAAPTSIPARFQGDWASTAEACAPGPADIENIRVTATAIIEFELRTRVTAVENTGHDALLIGRRTTHGASEYDNAMRMRLLDNGKALGVGEGEDAGTYVRCER